MIIDSFNMNKDEASFNVRGNGIKIKKAEEGRVLMTDTMELNNLTYEEQEALDDFMTGISSILLC